MASGEKKKRTTWHWEGWRNERWGIGKMMKKMHLMWSLCVQGASIVLLKMSTFKL
uniref:Uncharacterized protein n=1 Tax=Timema tahoe TaxID=61484 RepID=A0A7R9INB9_9NEOP|nr:unnamed protein product [Timema tahoe]